MNIINNIKKTVSSASKPKEKENKKIDDRDFLRESPDEYAIRLKNRRSRGY